MPFSGLNKIDIRLYQIRWALKSWWLCVSEEPNRTGDKAVPNSSVENLKSSNEVSGSIRLPQLLISSVRSFYLRLQRNTNWIENLQMFSVRREGHAIAVRWQRLFLSFRLHKLLQLKVVFFLGGFSYFLFVRRCFKVFLRWFSFHWLLWPWPAFCVNLSHRCHSLTLKILKPVHFVVLPTWYGYDFSTSTPFLADKFNVFFSRCEDLCYPY